MITPKINTDYFVYTLSMSAEILIMSTKLS